MQKAENTIPVYDICSLDSARQLRSEVIAEPFAAYLQVHPNLKHAHRHSFYHFVLFTEGGGFHTIDFERFPVQAGQVYFMIPGQVHSWNFEGAVDGYVVNFSENLLSSFLADAQYPRQFPWFQGSAADSVFVLSASCLTQATELIKKIVSETLHTDNYSLDRVRACLLELFVVLRREYPEQAPNAPQQNQLTLLNFRKLVDSYYTEKHLPKDYAAMLYITPNHLNALSKDMLGKPAGEVIRDRVLLEARRLLVNADQSIAQVGYQLGFSDNSHFTKFFKKYAGVTPDEFRKQLLHSQK
ncbi:MAG: helix-turn-helix transcriptional regulator [Bacteroidota bacterium]